MRFKLKDGMVGISVDRQQFTPDDSGVYDVPDALMPIVQRDLGRHMVPAPEIVEKRRGRPPASASPPPSR